MDQLGNTQLFPPSSSPLSLSLDHATGLVRECCAVLSLCVCASACCVLCSAVWSNFAPFPWSESGARGPSGSTASPRPLTPQAAGPRFWFLSLSLFPTRSPPRPGLVWQATHGYICIQELCNCLLHSFFFFKTAWPGQEPAWPYPATPLTLHFIFVCCIYASKGKENYAMNGRERSTALAVLTRNQKFYHWNRLGYWLD